MKHIKLFEAYDQEKWRDAYKEGDYILFKNSRLDMYKFNNRLYIFKYAKIIDINSEDHIGRECTFEIIVHNPLEDDKDAKFFILGTRDKFDSIERKLTPKEIEEFELKKNKIKYNL